MPKPNHLRRNTFALLISNSGGALLSFGLSVLIGRALGEDGLGVYATALAWAFPISMVADFGLGTLITRDVAQEPDSETAYLRSVVSARVVIGGGSMLILWLAAPFVSGNVAVVQAIQISAPLVLILPFFGVFTAIFRARQAMWPIPWLNMGMLVVQVVLTTLVFLAGGGVAGALVVNTLTSTGQLIVAYGMYQRWFVVKQPRAAAIRQPSPADYTRALLKRAWPFALAAILAALQARLGIILLEQLSDTHEVGLYAAASRFVEAGRMIPNAIFGALLPALVSLTARPAAVDRLFSRATLGLSVLSGTTGLVLILLATPLLITTFGEDFQPATPVLQIGALALLPALLRGLRTLYWYALGQEQFVNRITAGTLILQIILMFQLIPQFGALGVVIATPIVESVGLILLWFSVGTRSKSRDRTETT